MCPHDPPTTTARDVGVIFRCNHAPLYVNLIVPPSSIALRRGCEDVRWFGRCPSPRGGGISGRGVGAWRGNGVGKRARGKSGRLRTKMAARASRTGSSATATSREDCVRREPYVSSFEAIADFDFRTYRGGCKVFCVKGELLPENWATECVRVLLSTGGPP